MKLIKPSQISGEIMTLIEEADKYLILISPYCNFKGWNKFRKSINLMSKKNIEVSFYVREDKKDSINEVKALGYHPYTIKNLHTKLYINEKYAIVSSMNLLKSSDDNSLDIAYKTETQKEFDEILEYYERYVNVRKSDERIFDDNWPEEIVLAINKNRNSKFRAYFDRSSLVIQGPNRYEIDISNENGKNKLNISGILSHAQWEALCPIIKDFSKQLGLEVEIYEGNGRLYDTIRHHSTEIFKSSDLAYLLQMEKDTIIKAVVKFIIGIENFKDNTN